MNNIWIECSVIDLKTNRPKGKYTKSFDNRGDYNSWYTMVKSDYDTVLNIMLYNPEFNAGQKAVNDSKLLKLSRGLPT